MKNLKRYIPLSIAITGILIFIIWKGFSYFGNNNDNEDVANQIDKMFTNVSTNKISFHEKEKLADAVNKAKELLDYDPINDVAVDLAIKYINPNKKITDIPVNYKKIAFRNLVDAIRYDYSTDLDEIIERSKERVQYLNNVLKVAELKYGVVVTEGEVNEYIKETIHPFDDDLLNAYIETLGISKEQFNFIFDRDFYILDVLYNKLVDKLLEVHSNESFHNITEIFKEEVKNFNQE